jgi:membrane-bound serine protease (ClpP class)
MTGPRFISAVRAAIWIVCTLIGAAGLAAPFAGAQETAQRQVLIVEVTGVIGVATTLHIEKGLAQAKRDGAELVVLRIDTPGGLVSSTREIVQLILASPVPVAGFVAPSGAHAASAGTFIMAATHVAGMAPGTQIGAATPIALGAPAVAPGDDKEKKPSETEGAAERKALNDSIAWIRSLGQMRGRNVEWLEKAVRDAATLTGEDAVRERVVELSATDVTDFVRKLDGREVKLTDVVRKLSTANADIVTIEPDWRTVILSAIADPNIAFILLMIGVYGILFEFYSPGAVAPGVVGGICLLLGLAALTALPLNIAGLALLLFGIALMVAEKFSPSFGVLGIGGVVAFVAGALFLFDPEGADVDISVSWPLIAGATLTSVALMMLIAGFALQAYRREVVIGGHELIGAKGEVVEWDGLRGGVRVRGEIWSAEADRGFALGDVVQVKERRGLVLVVAPVGRDS